MKQTVSKSDFRDAFQRMNRGNNFSYEGLGALFDWFEEYDEDSDTETELDVIVICCEFTEYEDLAEFNENYGEEFETLDQVGEKTSVIDIDGTSFIIVCY